MTQADVRVDELGGLCGEGKGHIPARGGGGGVVLGIVLTIQISPFALVGVVASIVIVTSPHLSFARQCHLHCPSPQRRDLEQCYQTTYNVSGRCLDADVSVAEQGTL